MPTFMVARTKPLQIQDMFVHMFMRVKTDGIIWTNEPSEANTYPSKYAAKKHLRQLDNVPEDVKIIELVQNGENTNG